MVYDLLFSMFEQVLLILSKNFQTGLSKQNLAANLSVQRNMSSVTVLRKC